jgi:hypothetical protein
VTLPMMNSWSSETNPESSGAQPSFFGCAGRWSDKPSDERTFGIALPFDPRRGNVGSHGAVRELAAQPASPFDHR